MRSKVAVNGLTCLGVGEIMSIQKCVWQEIVTLFSWCVCYQSHSPSSVCVCVRERAKTYVQGGGVGVMSVFLCTNKR